MKATNENKNTTTDIMGWGGSWRGEIKQFNQSPESAMKGCKQGKMSKDELLWSFY